MNERYLQWIWSQKRLPFHNLWLTDGREVHIHDVGQINLLDAGPDFHMGSITLNEIKLIGDIEIHVRSSEWYRHGHHNDPKYNSVVLHVVYEDDRPVELNGEVIPTLELRSLIDKDHFNIFQKFHFNYAPFVCQRQLDDVPTIYLSNMFDKSLHLRLLGKARVLIEKGILNEEDGYYHFLAAAFGANRNREGFLNLITKVHPIELKKLNQSQIVELYMAESGVYMKGSAQIDLWNYRMVRPGNSPMIRVQQFAHLMAATYLDVSFHNENATSIIDHFSKLFNSFNQHLSSNRIQKLSKDFINHLLINSISPFLYYLAEVKEDEMYRDKALEVLQLLKPERNTITEKWRSIIDIKSAYISQALLSLNSQFCSRKKCLNCEVGNHILNRHV